MRRLPRNFHAAEHGAHTPPHPAVLFPARTVLPFLRTPLGYETARPGRAIGAVLILTFAPLLVWMVYTGIGGHRPPDNIGHVPLILFALASLALYGIIFARRAIGQRRGEEIHTAEAGYSYLAWHTHLPVSLCEQVIVPTGLAAVGWVIAQSLSFELGWWLVACGVSYLVMARWEYTRRLAQARSTVDDMIRAQTFEERLADHERQARAQHPAKATPQGAYDSGHAPEMAELAGDGDERAPPPDLAQWNRDGGGATPTTLGWIRRGRGASNR